jgi:hypothetical protein
MNKTKEGVLLNVRPECMYMMWAESECKMGLSAMGFLYNKNIHTPLIHLQLKHSFATFKNKS